MSAFACLAVIALWPLASWFGIVLVFRAERARRAWVREHAATAERVETRWVPHQSRVWLKVDGCGRVVDVREM